MKGQVTFERNTAYLRAICRGEFTPTTTLEALGSIHDEAVKSGHTRVLIDALDQPAPPPEMVRYQFGLAVADVFGHRFKVAMLYPEALINRFGENTAVNRGAFFRAFGDEQAALHWLVGNEG